MEKVKKNKMSSIRASMFLYFCVALIVAQLLYMGSIVLIDNAMMGFMDPVPDAFVLKDGKIITINYSDTDSMKSSEVIDAAAFERLKLLRSVCPILIYGLSVIAATFLFYHWKLKRNLNALNAGIEKIAEQELNFHVVVHSADELGQLCDAFEKMRVQLSDTFQRLWRSEENQRNMYRAFAHDLRTPLTVVKGNNEIIELVAAKNDDWEQAKRAVTVSNEAIHRIELYADQVRQMESIDDWSLEQRDVDIQEFVQTYRQQAEVLASNCEKTIQIRYDDSDIAHFDSDLVIRVLDNLVSNGLQHAAEAVVVNIVRNGDELQFSVSDDGNGFSAEAMKHATTPFFTTDKSGGHMGVGLSICQKLLEKHQSVLGIENGPAGGANISFSLAV